MKKSMEKTNQIYQRNERAQRNSLVIMKNCITRRQLRIVSQEQKIRKLKINQNHLNRYKMH